MLRGVWPNGHRLFGVTFRAAPVDVTLHGMGGEAGQRSSGFDKSSSALCNPLPSCSTVRGSVRFTLLACRGPAALFRVDFTV